MSSAIERRRFLGSAARLVAAGATFAPSASVLGAFLDKKHPKPLLRVGLLTDLHYADKPAGGSRHYRDTLEKIRPAIQTFNKSKVDLVVQLGDLVDVAPNVETELGYLKRIEKELEKCRVERHYVLGNHCVATLTKAEFLANCGLRRKAKDAFYSFDSKSAEGDSDFPEGSAGAFHFVVLDACYRADEVSYQRKNFKWTDTEIPRAQREWLKKDLAATKKPTIVLAHQRLDVKGHYGVKSAPEVRKILEESKKVLAVFQGHNHVNEHKSIGGIHYITLAAMIEGPAKKKGNNAYAVLACHAGGVLEVDGFAAQKDWSLPKTPRTTR
jgi:alkaline phosphatase